MSRERRIYRIRRCIGYKGGSNYYDHADVIASCWSAALKAAREGRVRRWRQVDKFDDSDETYLEFEYLYRVNPEGYNVKPQTPDKKRPKNWNPPPKRSFESYLSFGSKRYGAKNGNR